MEEIVNDYIILFNGSPHIFEHFDISKVGTGTGDTLYGFGLYFADHIEESKYYGNKASGTTFELYGEKYFFSPKAFDCILSALNNDDLNLIDKDYNKTFKYDLNLNDLISVSDKAIEKIHRRFAKSERYKKRPDEDPVILADAVLSASDEDFLYKAIADLKKIQNVSVEEKQIIHFERSRSLYSVKAHIFQKDLFVWEKPVSKDLKINVEKTLNSHGRTLGEHILNSEVPGSEFYHFLSDNMGGPKKASEFLLSADVLGLKYNSDDKKGMNYVIFDDSLIEIQDRVAFKKITKESELPDRTETKEYCRKVIENIHSRSNNDVQIVFVDKARDLPQHIQQQCGFDVNVSGVNVGSKCYFVLDNICNHDDAVNIWLHEVGQHNGIKNIIPNKAVREELFCKVWESANKLAQNPKNAEIRRAVAAVRNNYDVAQFSKSELGSEFLAHFSESAFIRNRLNDTEKSFFQSIGRAIRQIIDKCFHIDSKPYMSIKDLTRLIVTSIRSNFRQNSWQQQDLKLQNLFRMNMERKHNSNILSHRKLSVS